MTLAQIKHYLSNATNNYTSRNSDVIAYELKQLKQVAVASGNENFANALWVYEQVLVIQDKYISAFSLIKDEKFYDAWCAFAHAEKLLYFLRPFRTSKLRGFHLDFIEEHVQRFQSLFPYRMFMSIEAINKRKTCSICGEVVRLRHSCGHQPGELYNGEMCSRRVEEADIIGIAMVQSPEDKCCVAFPNGDGDFNTRYDCSLVRYPASVLLSPFDEWSYEWTKTRHPHSRYVHVSGKEACPCESGKIYEECCLIEAGVLRPHIGFNFSNVPSWFRSEVIYY